MPCGALRIRENTPVPLFAQIGLHNINKGFHGHFQVRIFGLIPTVIVDFSCTMFP